MIIGGYPIAASSGVSQQMKIEDLLFVVGALVAVALLLWYLFGNSPTIDQLLVGLMVANLTFSFKIYGDLQKHLGEHQGQQKEILH